MNEKYNVVVGKGLKSWFGFITPVSFEECKNLMNTLKNKDYILSIKSY